MKEEGSDKRNRKRKRNNQDEDEKRNPNFDSDDNDDDSDVGVKMQSWDMSIKEGDKFDIPTLHSNSSTEYLIKNNREKVQIEDHFFGKCTFGICPMIILCLM